jgi:hypothetical protein
MTCGTELEHVAKQICYSVDSFESPPRFAVSSLFYVEVCVAACLLEWLFEASFVSCPIALYPATTATERVSFRQVNRRAGHRLKHQLVDTITGRPWIRTTRRGATRSARTGFCWSRNSRHTCNSPVWISRAKPVS